MTTGIPVVSLAHYLVEIPPNPGKIHGHHIARRGLPGQAGGFITPRSFAFFVYRRKPSTQGEQNDETVYWWDRNGPGIDC